MAETYRAIDRSEAALGRPVRTHARLPRVGPAPLIIAASFAGFLWWKALDAERIAGAAWVMTALAVVCGIGFALDLTRRQLSSAVTVHEHGLALHRLSGAGVLRWDDITALEFVRERRLRQQTAAFMPLPGMIVYSDPTEWHWVCRVRVERHVAIELGDRFADSSALVEMLRRETLDRMVPRALEELRGGGRVQFGLVEVAEGELDVRGRTIPWSKVGELTVSGPLLRVTDHDGEELARASVEKIPNVHVLIALADLLKKPALTG